MGNTQDYNVIWQLDREDGRYFEGETVTGHAYISNKSVLSFRKTLYITYVIRLSQDRSTKQAGDAHSKKSLRHCLYSKHKPVLAITHNDAGGEDLDSHTLKVKIIFPLPELMPPTLHSDSGNQLIVHCIEISQDGRIDKALDSDRSMIINVFPKVDLTYYPVNPVEYRSPDKHVFVYLQLSSNAVLPGEALFVKYAIINHKAFQINNFSLEFIQLYNVENVKGERVLTGWCPSNVRGSACTDINGMTELLVPSGAFPPTCTFVGGAHRHYSISIEYVLRCILKISSILHSDIRFQIPVMMGTHGNIQSSSLHTNVTYKHGGAFDEDLDEDDGTYTDAGIRNSSLGFGNLINTQLLEDSSTKELQQNQSLGMAYNLSSQNRSSRTSAIPTRYFNSSENPVNTDPEHWQDIIDNEKQNPLFSQRNNLNQSPSFLKSLGEKTSIFGKKMTGGVDAIKRFYQDRLSEASGSSNIDGESTFTSYSPDNPKTSSETNEYSTIYSVIDPYREKDRKNSNSDDELLAITETGGDEKNKRKSEKKKFFDREKDGQM